MNQQAMMRLKKMQKQMMEAQEKLEATVFTATAGGGAVTVKVKGNHEVVGIEIDEEECLKHPYVPHTLRHYTGALTDIRPAKTEFYF